MSDAELQGLMNIAEGMHQDALERIAEYEHTHCSRCHRFLPDCSCTGLSTGPSQVSLESDTKNSTQP